MTRLLLMLGLAGVALAPAQESTIHVELNFRVPPHRVYEALLDAKQFSAFSGLPAEINREAGGHFSLFSGQITGRNVELIPDRRIVQAWRATAWPEGAYSIARFEIAAEGSGCHLVFDHSGFPPELREHLAGGWQQHYWAPLKKYFGE